MSDRWERLRRKDRASPETAPGSKPADAESEQWWDVTTPKDEPTPAGSPDAARPHAPRTPEEIREAFRKKRRSEPTQEPQSAAFEDYYSTESLFEGDGPGAPGLFDPDDPYAVLGVAPTATWEQIMAAHRRLAKLHHPDRLLNATPEDRQRSEDRMRDINIAYAELKRRRNK